MRIRGHALRIGTSDGPKWLPRLYFSNLLKDAMKKCCDKWFLELSPKRHATATSWRCGNARHARPDRGSCSRARVLSVESGSARPCTSSSRQVSHLAFGVSGERPSDTFHAAEVIGLLRPTCGRRPADTGRRRLEAQGVSTPERRRSLPPEGTSRGPWCQPRQGVTVLTESDGTSYCGAGSMCAAIWARFRRLNVSSMDVR